MTAPLVSIGIPTYRRPALLQRALGSAQAQTHTHLEIIVSDNASGDETAAICRAAAAEDSRVRYLCHPSNIGPTANFNGLFAACAGEFVMMLADDDWLEPAYVEQCLKVLLVRPDVVLVAGRARNVRGAQEVSFGQWHRHLSADPAERVYDYLTTVRDNGVFYGLVRGEAMRVAGSMPNALGNDWLHIARIAAQGGIEMIDSAHVVRELDGTSVDVGSILQTFGRGGWQARVPQLVIAAEIIRDLWVGGPPYRALPGGRRRALAIRAGFASISWPDLAWHLVTPTVSALARRPRGRGVWSAYLRVARALGAGSD